MVIDRDTIAKTALLFIGKKEIKGNMGFVDKEFEKLMQSVGHNKGEAWCALFAELVWKLAAVQNQFLVAELSKLFSKSATRTFTNFKEAGWKIGDKGEHGDLIVWRRYKDGTPTWMGHMGIVIEYRECCDEIVTVEGNTNIKGLREGDRVAIKSRKIEEGDIVNGLKRLGFIKPIKDGN